MRHFILTTMLALLTVTAAQAERRVETVTDSLNNVTKLIELDGDDTLSITTYEGTKAEAVGLAVSRTADSWDDDYDDYFMGVSKSIVSVTLSSSSSTTATRTARPSTSWPRKSWLRDSRCRPTSSTR